MSERTAFENIMLKTFRGGVHPHDGKKLTKEAETVVLSPVGELVFPLVQHIGAPAKPLVQAGDRVLVGQRIAEAGGFISADICCSVSGTVKAIEPRQTASGELCESIIVTNDSLYETADGFGVIRDVEKLTPDEIRKIIKEAGIVGLGGAGFPTAVKLTPKDSSKIDYIIVNGAECEPYITADYRLMLEEPEKIIEGIKIVLSLFENAKAVIGIEDNKPLAIETMQKYADGRISVCKLKTKYPQGGERMLVGAVTGRRLNRSQLPADKGCEVVNVATAYAIAEAVKYGKPLVDRIVTVTGDAINKPGNFRVRIGTCQQELIDAAGGFSTNPEKLISGGPMMGAALYTADIPVTKTSSAILAMSYDAVAANEPTACINCGSCVRACPEKLLPLRLMEAADMMKLDMFEKYNGLECIECGSCTYVCPAKRRLTQSFKYCKMAINAKKKKEAAKSE